MTEGIKIYKRNSEMSNYDGNRIKLAISKAMEEVHNETDMTIVEEIEETIASMIYSEDEHIWTVDEISDEIENLLMEFGLNKVAKAFILYRADRDKNREKAWEMSDLQYDIWHQKYENENEGFEGWLDRVSLGDDSVKKLIRQKKFLPAGRILTGLGLDKLGRKITLSNCYVVTPPEDNLESIFDTAKSLARTFSYGGGCGIDIGKLRPNNAKVNNAAKTTSGSVSFMDLYSMVTGLIGQQGRRGALMISIPVDHPDIEEFITVKQNLDKVTKANISIRITDEFMKAVLNKEKYTLTFTVEDTGEVIEREVDADELFTKFCYSNWDYAEPGILGWSRIEDWNLVSEDKEFKFAGVNPCARRRV